MFAQTSPSVGNPFGTWDFPAIAADGTGSGTSIARGKIVRFYGATTLESGATTADFGAFGKYFSHVMVLEAAQLTANVGNIRLLDCAVCLGDVTVGQQGRFRGKGIVQALVDGTTDVAVGDPLTVDASGNLVKATADDTRVVAWALEAYTDATAALKTVKFNGEQCFGLLGNLA